MRQAYRILPVYSGDVSGVCSALFELGGMVVMHDPSGCNSTYNTHDEIRWYDEDSLIFLSGLSEPDAIMGNDEKFIQDVTEAAQTYHPRFIALCNSPIPYLNGTDFAGISAVVQKRTGIKTFYIQTNGMHDYVRGAGLALEAVARELVEEVPRKEAPDFSVHRTGRRSVNILGLSPLDFAAEGETDSLVHLLDAAGWTVQSCWSMGEYVAGIPQAGEAAVNLVVSSTGMRAAQVLRERFGTPWVAGIPVGAFREELFAEMERAVREDRCLAACAVRTRDREKDSVVQRETAVIIGEAVSSCSLAAALAGEKIETTVLCTTEDGEKLLSERDRVCLGEEEVETALSSLRPGRIIADPMYRLILPADFAGEFLDVPHLAFSGRIYLRDMISKFDWNAGPALHMKP